MKLVFVFGFLFVCSHLFGQTIRKENLTKKETVYYDFEKKHPESVGAYYKDPLGETRDKHGKWLHYDKAGVLIEERNYFRGKLSGPVKAYYSNGKLKQEGYFKLDVQDSIYREWTESGKLQVEGMYVKGSPAKTWRYFYLDGREKSVEEIVDSTHYLRAFWLPDSLHTQTIIDGNGTFTTFYTTGAPKEWYNYKNGLKNGDFEEYSIYGFRLIQGKFLEGEKDSTWNYWYYTGDLEKVSNYKAGKLHGAYKYYYDKNRLNVEGTYTNGKKSGTWTWYTNKGTKDMEGTFVNDQQDGKWTYWYPTGEVSYYAEYTAGLKTGTWTYFYKDGKTFKKGEFANDQKNGKWETWYEDGTLLMSGKYENGKEEGAWFNYWENGKLKNKTTFKKGLLEGEWLSYYPSGKPKLTGKYKDGLKTGEWIDYFENGKPKDVGSYKIVKKKVKIDYGPLKDMESLESVKDGLWTSYSQKDYKRIEEGNYKNGEKDGVWYAYFPGGKIPCVTTTYKNGKLEGKMTELDRRGNVISDCDYKDGLKHGKMRLYDKKGKITKEMEFEFGQRIIRTENKSIQFNPN